MDGLGGLNRHTDTRGKRHTNTMQEYDIEKTVGIDLENKTFVEFVAEEVNAVMAELGHESNLFEMLEPAAGSNPDEIGAYVTPDTSEQIDEAMENGFGWLSINEDLAGHFGRSRGSSNVTAIAVKEELTARETIKAIAEATHQDGTDNIDKGIHLLELMRAPDDPHENDLMAYNLFSKALGWYSERILAETGDFKKGSVSNDKGGIDFYHNGTPVQLKTVVRYASKGPKHFRSKDMEHMFYQWAGQQIVVGTTDEANDVNKRAASLLGLPSDVTATNIKKSYGGGIMDGYGRTARVLWV